MTNKIISVKLGTIHLNETCYPPQAFEDVINTCVKGHIDVHVTWEDGYTKNIYQPFDDGKLTNASIPKTVRRTLESQCKGKLQYAHLQP